jgi:hypothetical protein
MLYYDLKLFRLVQIPAGVKGAKKLDICNAAKRKTSTAISSA